MMMYEVLSMFCDYEIATFEIKKKNSCKIVIYFEIEKLPCTIRAWYKDYSFDVRFK